MNKVIHYCWFGRNALPESARKCIESWKKYCPDYEIVQWNEDNFDCTSCDYIKEAYEHKRWAFVSDYARFWILYNYGGLYFDTDVELIRPIDDLVERGPFMGLERDMDFQSCIKKDGVDDLYVNPGLGLRADSGLKLYAEILDEYKDRHFIDASGKEDITTVVQIVSKILERHTVEVIDEITLKIGELYIYRKDVFCPMDYRTGKLTVTDRTRSIHHYTASWMTADELRNQEIFIEAKAKYGEKLGKVIGYIKTIPLRLRTKGE